MSGKTRWYVTLHRTSAGEGFKVTVREDPRQRDSSPAELGAEFHGVEPLRQLLRILPPDRLAELAARADGKGVGIIEIEVPPGETEQTRARKVEQSLSEIKASAHYASVGPRWEQTAQRFENWRPMPGVRKVLVAEKCKNPECGKDMAGFVHLPDPTPMGFIGKSYDCEHCGTTVGIIAP